MRASTCKGVLQWRCCCSSGLVRPADQEMTATLESVVPPTPRGPRGSSRVGQEAEGAEEAGVAVSEELRGESGQSLYRGFPGKDQAGRAGGLGTSSFE